MKGFTKMRFDGCMAVIAATAALGQSVNLVRGADPRTPDAVILTKLAGTDTHTAELVYHQNGHDATQAMELSFEDAKVKFVAIERNGVPVGYDVQELRLGQDEAARAPADAPATTPAAKPPHAPAAGTPSPAASRSRGTWTIRVRPEQQPGGPVDVTVHVTQAITTAIPPFEIRYLARLDGPFAGRPRLDRWIDVANHTFADWKGRGRAGAIRLVLQEATIASESADVKYSGEFPPVPKGKHSVQSETLDTRVDATTSIIWLDRYPARNGQAIPRTISLVNIGADANRLRMAIPAGSNIHVKMDPGHEPQQFRGEVRLTSELMTFDACGDGTCATTCRRPANRALLEFGLDSTMTASAQVASLETWLPLYFDTKELLFLRSERISLCVKNQSTDRRKFEVQDATVGIGVYSPIPVPSVDPNSELRMSLHRYRCAAATAQPGEVRRLSRVLARNLEQFLSDPANDANNAAMWRSLLCGDPATKAKVDRQASSLGYKQYFADLLVRLQAAAAPDEVAKAQALVDELSSARSVLEQLERQLAAGLGPSERGVELLRIRARLRDIEKKLLEAVRGLELAQARTAWSRSGLDPALVGGHPFDEPVRRTR